MIDKLINGMVGYHLISSELDDECGCLEEEWEVTFDCESSGDFWGKLINYIDALPVLDA